MADEALTEIKLLLQKLTLEIEFGEKMMANKVDTTKFLEDTQRMKDDIFRAVRTVDKRIDNLYIKVMGSASLIAALITALLRLIP